MDINRLFFVAGIFLIVAGILFIFFSFGLKYLPLFKLPGDIVIEKKNFAFYFPIVSCIIISIILTIVLNILKRFFK